jgi:LacI family transcriptional regulator
VPEDIAVVGFDDIYPGSLSQPPLTTVHQPMGLIGERACARLLDRIADPSLTPRLEMLPTELVLRSSCGCPPGTMTRLPVRPLRGRSLPESDALLITSPRPRAGRVPVPASPDLLINTES